MNEEPECPYYGTDDPKWIAEVKPGLFMDSVDPFHLNRDDLFKTEAWALVLGPTFIWILFLIILGVFS